MPRSYRASWMQSPTSEGHSNEVENRLTKLEGRSDSHGTRITYLERMLTAIIYAIGLLATGKAGDLVEVIGAIMKARP